MNERREETQKVAAKVWDLSQYHAQRECDCNRVQAHSKRDPINFDFQKNRSQFVPLSALSVLSTCGRVEITANWHETLRCSSWARVTEFNHYRKLKHEFQCSRKRNITKSIKTSSELGFAVYHIGFTFQGQKLFSIAEILFDVKKATQDFTQNKSERCAGVWL